jgi:hypothetical protein
MEERRKGLRRSQDIALLEAYNRLKQRLGNSTENEVHRKLTRRAIRHHCTAKIARTGPTFSQSEDVWSPVTLAVKGRVLDLSLNGCSIFTKDSFDIGQSVDITITLEKIGDVRARAAARWGKALPEKGGYATGFQFQNLSGDDSRRVAAFLERMEQTAGL